MKKNAKSVASYSKCCVSPQVITLSKKKKWLVKIFLQDWFAFVGNGSQLNFTITGKQLFPNSGNPSSQNNYGFCQVRNWNVHFKVQSRFIFNNNSLGGVEEGGGWAFSPLLFYIVFFCFIFYLFFFHRCSWTGPLSEKGKKRGKGLGLNKIRQCFIRQI